MLLSVVYAGVYVSCVRVLVGIQFSRACCLVECLVKGLPRQVGLASAGSVVLCLVTTTFCVPSPLPLMFLMCCVASLSVSEGGSMRSEVWVMVSFRCWGVSSSEEVAMMGSIGSSSRFTNPGDSGAMASGESSGGAGVFSSGAGAGGSVVALLLLV